MSNVNLYENNTKTIPKSDPQVIRVGMEQIDIGGRKSHLPDKNKSDVLGVQHVPNAGSK